MSAALSLSVNVLIAGLPEASYTGNQARVLGDDGDVDHVPDRHCEAAEEAMSFRSWQKSRASVLNGALEPFGRRSVGDVKTKSNQDANQDQNPFVALQAFLTKKRVDHALSETRRFGA
ncbi:unnamed protein product [Microthlaspi erraticum]|uniref:Uncharacterized protein n=1 Tax=Microthlaspi erraticum TaxID=1685480 RepID=A0A6D2IRD6_9BRAS|nr:unnamed protein product [Microthlaspi erraticum]